MAIRNVRKSMRLNFNPGIPVFVLNYLKPDERESSDEDAHSLVGPRLVSRKFFRRKLRVRRSSTQESDHHQSSGSHGPVWSDDNEQCCREILDQIVTNVIRKESSQPATATSIDSWLLRHHQNCWIDLSSHLDLRSLFKVRQLLLLVVIFTLLQTRRTHVGNI